MAGERQRILQSDTKGCVGAEIPISVVQFLTRKMDGKPDLEYIAMIALTESCLAKLKGELAMKMLTDGHL